MTTSLPSRNTSRYALALLLAVNLLNYVDRQALYAVFPLIKADLALSDTALGFLGSAFMFVYMCSAPVLGWVGDRWSRIRLASLGLACWSIATVCSGLASGYRSLLAARALVGVGEASFGTVSPGLVADHFPTERRGRVLSAFYLAIPVGSALGYLAGGYLGQHFGWKSAFLMVGAPGLLLVPLVARLRDPGRSRREVQSGSGLAAYAAFFRNRSFVFTTLAMAAMTFALGGLAQWVPTFLCRSHGLDVGKANLLFGGITVVAGIAGTAAGGWLGDFFQRRTPRGYLLVSGCGFVLGTPAAAWAILDANLTSALIAIFIAEFFLFLNTGPLNTVIVNVSPTRARAMAFALNIFFIHALGDAVSPAIIGAASDRFGLRNALLLAPATILVAALFCFICGKFIASDLVTEE